MAGFEKLATTSFDVTSRSTWMDVDPVIELVTVSVAVTVWLPAVFRVTLKLPAPLVRVELAGSTAWESPDVM